MTRRPPAPRQVPVDDFAAWVLRQARLDPAAYRSRVFARRIPSCLRALKVDSVPAAIALLERRHDLLPAVLSNLLIGVTEFFRDREVFEGLWKVALPQLAGRPWPPRVWTAACSSGAETYSVAMLLDQAGLLEGATILATDCRDEAIDQARIGNYGTPATLTLPPALAETYFRPCGPEALRPVEKLRAAVVWKVADVLAAVEPGPWDIVFWRNSGIYLEPEATAAVCRRLVSTLAPGGFLVVGKAERPPADLRLARVWRCLYQKTGASDAC